MASAINGTVPATASGLVSAAVRGNFATAWSEITALQNRTDSVQNSVALLQTALAAKQNTLVSGTNIKTINGATLLGAGDLAISASGGTWGSITGTLSAQTDLNAALGGKQNTLVSGTTIKTINGTTLLGAGDLAITGGGGLPTTGGAITGSAPGSLVIGNPVDGSLGPGTLNTSSTIQVNASSAPASSLPAGTHLHVEGDDNARILLTGWGGDATFLLRSSHGSGASPIPLVAGNYLGIVGFGGYTPGGWAVTPARRAGVVAIAAENWTATAQGTALWFETTAIGANSDAVRMQLGQGLVVGSQSGGTNGDMGVGSVNATEFYRNGVPIGIGGGSGLPLTGGALSGPLVVNNSGVAPPAVTGPQVLQLASTGNTALVVDAAGATQVPRVSIRRAAGALNSLVALPVSAQLGFLEFVGWTGSAWGGGANIQCTTTAAWNTGSAPVRLDFQTTPVGSVLPTLRMWVGAAGGLVVGFPGGGDRGAGSINAESMFCVGDFNTGGTIYIQGLAVQFGANDSAGPGFRTLRIAN